MSDAVISVENLSKRYLVGHLSDEREKYLALRDVLGREARNFLRKTVNVVRGQQVVQGDEVEEVWALKDVSFDVQRGEAIEIIEAMGPAKARFLKSLVE